ncbi:MAG: class I SAM-dependent methyltransferase [Deltaproteobacteria bacterium]|nr:class I SAM-dependent methyltransferase [Deltaproteobacteria bacterium]
MRLEAQAKAGFYPTPPKVVDIIKTWIGEKMAGPRRLLDPCCGTGEPAAQIAAAAGCDAYGIEINTERAQAAKRILTKIVAGDLFSVRARPGAFSILYLNPPYDFDAEDGRTELSFLKHTLPYLAPRGLLLFVVPQKRITNRIARVLSAYFEDLKVRKFPPDEFQAFGQIVIAGIKKARAEINGEVLASLSQISTMDLPEMVRKEFSFSVPAVGKDFFIRSAEFGPDELAEELTVSSLWKEPALGLIEEEDQIRPAIQPLMPPRKAHLAMLIAAGLINNQILEANSKKFLIKGTSKKTIDRFEEETEKGIKITERERIVTQINAFDLKTGEYLQIV